MRLLAAILILIPALLLLGLAYHGYAEDAANQAALRGTDYDRFAARASGGVSPDRAREQVELAIAGCEGVLGLGFLCCSFAVCGPEKKRQEHAAGAASSRMASSGMASNAMASSGMNERVPRRLHFSAKVKAAAGATDRKPRAAEPARENLDRSGRARLEELRRVRSLRLKARR